jgi:hypothetical protein
MASCLMLEERFAEVRRNERQLDTGEGFIFSVGKEPVMKDAYMSSLSQYFSKPVYQTE